MSVWIALLRGVNVGGHNKLPMKELASALADRGFKCVQTYIQSGNVVFRSTSRSSTRLAQTIGDAIEEQKGFRPPVLVIGRSEFEKTVAANPFPDAEDEADGKALHVFFFESKPKRIDRAALDAVRHASESWKASGKALYLHGPKGFHGSKLAAKVERAVGVPATARNWRTVSKLLAMVGDA
ncbi:MAG: DUF1697 domain-containing protein [bacterium]|nr:DUF1697 domain-containing protein [bacterium]